MRTPGRKRSPTALVALLAVITTAMLVFTVSGPLAHAATSAAPVRGTAHDGADLLRGLFFGQGPIAELYPELALTRLEGAEGQTMVDRLVTEARRLDAGFLARFAAGVQSGNQVRVKAALEEAAQLLRRAINRAYGPTVPDRAPPPGADIAIAIQVFQIVAVASNAVSIVNALIVSQAFAVTEVAIFWVAGRQSLLRTEVWVDDVTRTLKV